MDTVEFMESSANYRIGFPMVQPFFEVDEGGTLPDHPIVKHVPLTNEAGVRAEKRVTHPILRIVRKEIRLAREKNAIRRRMGASIERIARNRALIGRVRARKKWTLIVD